MRKFLSLILCVCLAISAHALTQEQYQFEYNDQNITIVFDNSTIFTNDERQYIADCLAYGKPDEGISAHSWCWLTGHDLVSDSVIEIQHKVTPDAPRCLKTTYEVITCTKCDHMETKVLSSVFIPCCPED